MKKVIIANWKLNPLTVIDAKKLAAKIGRTNKYKVVVCPPTLFLTTVSYPNLGAQDAFWKNKGPFTGQTSPEALWKLGVRYCLVGHSEKREAGETDVHIQQKLGALIEARITPVLCVGYGTTVELDDLEVMDVLKLQLDADLKNVYASKVIVAYEPVWAISGGNPFQTKTVESPEHAERVAIFISSKYHVDKVLYGGSVNSTNAKSFLDQAHIDGLLVGGSSLLPDEFNKIIAL
jgi:triosephosphate isomerase